MTDAAPAIFVALEDSALGATIRQSTWVYMVANVGHILSLMAFAAAIAVIDLRMMGMFAAIPPGYVLRMARWVAVAAFAGLWLTGSLLFIAEAAHMAVNGVFQVKLLLIALGLISVVASEVWLTPKLQKVPPFAPLPQEARPLALASLAIWLCVAVCGRLIAYF